MSDNMNCGCNFNGVLNLVFPNGDNVGIPGLGYMMPVVKFGARTTVVEETTLAFTKDNDNDWYVSGDDSLGDFSKADFEFFNLYKITWDGVEYDCFYADMSYFYEGTTIHTVDFIGNPAAFKFSVPYQTDAPFCVSYSWPNEYAHVLVWAFDSAAASHTIKIEKIPYTVTIVPGQYYLPGGGEPMIAGGRGDDSYIQSGARDASGKCSHAEGFATIASAKYSHAEGAAAEATGNYAHAEGFHTNASGIASHAEGSGSESSGYYSHAEGTNTKAGHYAHAEGISTSATGQGSHAEGHSTIAKKAYQHVFGDFNVADPKSGGVSAKGYYIEIVGNGTADDARSNARTLDWEGNETLAGSLTLGSTTLTEQQLIALLELLN